MRISDWSSDVCSSDLGFFILSAKIFFTINHPPEGALPISVVAKQWMWKFQHPDGQAEINMLHVPVGNPVRLTMTSQDVIHSLYVPALRLKQDVLPGRYTELWFTATRPGRSEEPTSELQSLMRNSYSDF